MFGKLKEAYLKDAIFEYSKRLSKYCMFEIIEVPDEKVPTNASQAEQNKIIEKECAFLASNLKESSYVIALDLTGKQYSSEEFSEKIQNLSLRSFSHITFVIGGTLGMSKEFLASVDERICFSKMTFPHQLIRVFLLEQLFRAFKIQNNETYHH